MTASVQREMHTSLLSSSVILISQTWVLRPTCSGVDAEFYALVPIEADTTALTARITNRSGRSMTTSVPITVQGRERVRLRATPFAGVAPAIISFEIEDDFGRAIAEIRADFDGDGDFELMTTNPDEPLEFEYTTPGLVYPRMLVTTTSGGQYEVTTGVVITDPAREDAIIQALWQDMKEALLAGNHEAALALFQPGSRPRYGEIFDALAEHMSDIVADFSAIHPITISSEGAEYAMATATERPRIYIPVFTRTKAGLWVIDSM